MKRLKRQFGKIPFHWLLPIAIVAWGVFILIPVGQDFVRREALATVYKGVADEVCLRGFLLTASSNAGLLTGDSPTFYYHPVNGTTAATTNSASEDSVVAGNYCADLTATETNVEKYTILATSSVTGALYESKTFVPLAGGTTYGPLVNVTAVNSAAPSTPDDVWSVSTRALTELDEDNTTIDLNATAVGSVAGAVGSVTGNVGGDVQGNVDGSVASVTAGVSLANGAITNASLAGNMEIVFETDFATNYNATRNAWVTNVQDTVGSGNLPADVNTIETTDATDYIESRTLAAAAYFDPAADQVADVSVSELQASALADLFNTDSGTTYGSAVAGSVVKETADNAGGSSLTLNDIADAVWDEALAGHATGGTSGAALSAAGSGADAATIADAVWDEALSGHTTAGTAGKSQSDTETAAGNVNTQVGTAGAGLTDLGGMSTGMKAEVNAEADTALTDYDAPTKSELDAGFAGQNDLDGTAVAAAVAGIVIEGSWTLQDAINILFNREVGVVARVDAGGGDYDYTYTDPTDTETRIEFTVNSTTGVRDAVTLTPGP